MTKIVKKTGSKSEWLWILAIRFIGFCFFIAPFYLPFISYFSTEIETVPMKMFDYVFAGLGFFLSSGARSIGVVVNNIGIAINKVVPSIKK